MWLPSALIALIVVSRMNNLTLTTKKVNHV